MDFAQFKKNRKKLSEGVKQLVAEKPSYVDDRFWKLKWDTSYNGEALIRFLPQKDINIAPIIRRFEHTHNKPKPSKKWLKVFCPSTIDKKCPMCEYASDLWNSAETDDEKKVAGSYSRKTKYIANILVIKDPAKPENNGKVFLYEFGPTIMKMINKKLQPESELVDPIMIHDLWEGQNFVLKTSKGKGGWPSYDDSTFLDKFTPVAKSDDEIEKIFNQLYDLNEFIGEGVFPSYENIKKKFTEYMGEALPKSTNNATSSTKTKVEEKVDSAVDSGASEEDFDFGDESSSDKSSDSGDDFDFGDDDSTEDVVDDASSEEEKVTSEETKTDDSGEDFNFDDFDDDFNFDE